jgi:hypothetical protein
MYSTFIIIANVKGLPINISCVELELETRSPKHIDHIQKELKKAGYDENSF